MFGVIQVWNKSLIPVIYATSLLIYLFNFGESPSISTQNTAPLILLFLGGALVFAIESHLNWKMTLIFSFLGTLVITPWFKYLALKLYHKIPFVWGPNFSEGRLINFIYYISLPFLVIGIGCKLKWFFRLKNDYSYGVYLYAWPCQQILNFWTGGTISVTQFFVGSFCMTFLLAFLSWHLLEKPSLLLKGWVHLRVSKIIELINNYIRITPE
jgi:peptidoglycan/LPS O-acetylase OafA/YrhL